MESQAILKITRPVKLLALVSAAFIVLTLVGGALGIVSLREFFLKAIDPRYMRETAMAITGLPEPLPSPDFNYVMAARSANSVVFMERPSDKAQVSYWSYAGDADTDPAQELDRAYDAGIVSPTSWPRFQSITSKGKRDINGRTVTFIQGPLKDPQGVTYEGIIACVLDGKKVLMLKDYQPSDRPFDTNQALGWLARSAVKQ